MMNQLARVSRLSGNKYKRTTGRQDQQTSTSRKLNAASSTNDLTASKNLIDNNKELSKSFTKIRTRINNRINRQQQQNVDLLNNDDALIDDSSLQIKDSTPPQTPVRTRTTRSIRYSIDSNNLISPIINNKSTINSSTITNKKKSTLSNNQNTNHFTTLTISPASQSLKDNHCTISPPIKTFPTNVSDIDKKLFKEAQERKLNYNLKLKFVRL